MIKHINDATILLFKIGDKVEMSTQIRGPVLINKDVQAANPIVIQEYLMRLIYPTLRNETVDDMVINLHKYAPTLFNTLELLWSPVCQQMQGVVTINLHDGSGVG